MSCQGLVQGATNFALFSANAGSVALCLFTEADLRAGRTTHEVPLDPLLNRTGDVWHVALPDLDPSLLYGAARWPLRFTTTCCCHKMACHSVHSPACAALSCYQNCMDECCNLLPLKSV